ncbi:MAG: hypothetical protein LBG31_00595 [Prevotellaceae bacterium]|nr:hypothetical protein [Prevotellaceae bacterium]
MKPERNSKDCWVSPSGQVIWVDFARHSEKAYEIIEQKGWSDDYRKWDFLMENRYKYSSDYLQEVRNYIRYCDWGVRPHWVLNPRITKKQEQRIFEIDHEKD